jgi:cell division protein FtsI (penicillin-binding protein 3)
VVGFTDINDQGQEGIELAYQTQLQGHSGSRGVVKDRLGRIVEDLGEPVDPRDGSDVQLTIDSKLQAIAYQRIRDAVEQFHAKAGSVVVLDAQTGEILAMANYPSYTPEERHNLTGGQLRNRAVTDVFEPGSTVKPFVVSKVIEDGYATPDTVLDTIDGRPAARRRRRPLAPSLTVAQIIQKSSNVGTVKLSQHLDPREMGELYAAVGFGSKPQIGFPAWPPASAPGAPGSRSRRPPWPTATACRPRCCRSPMPTPPSPAMASWRR